MSKNDDEKYYMWWRKEKQELSSVANFNVNALITGGDYDHDLGVLALVSYSSNGEQYLILFVLLIYLL